MKARFADSRIIQKYAESLEPCSKTGNFFRALKESVSQILHFKSGRVFQSGNEPTGERKRSKFRIVGSNPRFWLHLIILLLTMSDFVKDVNFSSAVNHYDKNVLQNLQTNDEESRYKQYHLFNVFYVYLTSVGLILSGQIVTYIYWFMLSQKPNFLMSYEQLGIGPKICQIVIQYLPSALPILLFVEDTSLKIAIGEKEDLEMDPSQFLIHQELLSEQILLEKVSLSIKIIEAVCETYGQLILQIVILIRLKFLIKSDFFKFLGIKFEIIILLSILMSVLSLFTTFWSYHSRSKKGFRSDFLSFIHII